METNVTVHDKEFELLLEEEAIAKRIRLMAIQLNVDYENRNPVFIGVLNGSFLFIAELMKEIDLACETEFVKVASYHGATSTGAVKDAFGMPQNLKDRDIIIVEDIIDSGLTMKYILSKIHEQEPASVAICTLLFKPDALKEEVENLSYIGFEIPNEFVVGYGLDYDGLGRNLNHIYRAI
ncbi:MAG: hypoxanthine phosphoribosyltransferase [Pedobacter sp.]|uniref:hypoxanthine phosphoribosyltransferase n=1 Tax=Pedobacter sp. TaxID=1411316 RepID=UPI002806E5C3|nr:hypoxanthine phosphoribosyltransferase [Pedobacter sp.]MDQ8003664.1 hypoxanthine phosphoribosyltransferase [Pedobacter sp.]